MKNKLYVVYGGQCEETEEGCIYFTKDLTDPIPFKNKDKADSYKEELIDKFMKTKSYSPNYSITDGINLDTPVKTTIVDVLNKQQFAVYRVETLEIDLSKIIL